MTLGIAVCNGVGYRTAGIAFNYRWLAELLADLPSLYVPRHHGLGTLSAGAVLERDIGAVARRNVAGIRCPSFINNREGVKGDERVKATLERRGCSNCD